MEKELYNESVWNYVCWVLKVFMVWSILYMCFINIVFVLFICVDGKIYNCM